MLNSIQKNISKPVNILFIITLFNKEGGAEKNLFNILLNIDKKKFSPHLCVFQGGELTDKIRQKKIPVFVNNLKKLFSLYAVSKGIELFTYIKKNKIKVVVTYHHDADIWGGIFARLAGVPVVISSRRDMGYQLTNSQLWFYRFFSFIFSAVISVSDAVKHKISNREWINKKKITTIHNGLFLEDFKESYKRSQILFELGVDEGKTIIGMTASLRLVKGQHFLVEAVGEIVEKHKDIQIVIVGYNNTDYFKSVKKKVEELGLQEYFIFTGDRNDIPRILSIFDIFIISSVSEGFSNAIIEAMAAGKPVIASKSGGNTEAVLHEKTGLLFTPCDSHSLALAIIKLLENSSLCKIMGENGRIRVKKQFQFDSMIKKNEDLYKYHICKPGFKLKILCGAKQIHKYYFKKTFKILASYFLYYSGCLWFYKVFFQKGQINILVYHNIDTIKIKNLEIEQIPENFKSQMKYLKKKYTVFSMEGFCEYRKQGRKFPKNSVMITFDDGYENNYSKAYPILNQLKIPATIFVSCDFIENKNVFYYDIIRYCIIRSKSKYLDLNDIGLNEVVLWNNNFYLAAIINNITSYFKLFPKHRQYEMSEVLLEKTGFSMQYFQDLKLYLSWDKIIKMSKNDIDFGSHTMSHAHLPSITNDDCRAELVMSKQTIEEKLGKKIKIMAYPFGGACDYNKTVETIAQKSGYNMGFSLISKVMDTKKFTIGRKMVDSHATMGLSGKFCKPLFAAELSGIFKYYTHLRGK